MPNSEDEFDAFDDFAGIDWTAVPELNVVPILQAPAHAPQPATVNINNGEDTTYDVLPDPFTGIDFNAVPALSNEGGADGGPSAAVRVSQEERPHSSHSSSHYSFDDIDDTVLLQVDAIESSFAGQAIGAQADGPVFIRRGGFSIDAVVSHALAPNRRAVVPLNLAATTSSVPGPEQRPFEQASTPLKKASKFFDHDHAPKRMRSDSPCSTITSPRKRSKKSKDKGKAREEFDPYASVRLALAGYEDELTCPICYEFLAAAYLGNPCGHTFCGECGWSWVMKNKRSPTCAICRKTLQQGAPMIPNFAMDNTIEKHITMLAANGHADWMQGGVKHTDWVARKEKWKRDAAKRAAEARRASAPPVRTELISTEDLAALIEQQEALDQDYRGSDDDSSDEESESDSDSDSGEQPAPVPVGLPPAPAFLIAPQRGRRSAARGQPGNRGRGQRGAWRGGQHGNAAGHVQDHGWRGRGRGRGGRGGAGGRT